MTRLQVDAITSGAHQRMIGNKWNVAYFRVKTIDLVDSWRYMNYYLMNELFELSKTNEIEWRSIA